MTSQHTIPTIPLNKLMPFNGNVRKTQNKAFIKELAASIGANGLQQNLIVQKHGKGYAVIAGGQRLKALQFLARKGTIEENHPVPCKIADAEIDPIELSLLENVMREDMHPADAFEAYRELVDKNIPVADIAARFGKPENHIRQLLKLARVSPAIIKAYRSGELNLEQVMAFAISDDHAAQEQVFGNLSPYDREPRSIRAALTNDEVSATDRRVQFVTLEAYEKAEGKLRRDLFSDSFYLLDVELLNSLVTAKLERSAKSVAKEGWKWVEIAVEFGYEQKSRFKRVYAEAAPLPPKLAAKAARLEEKLEALREEWNAAEDDSEEPARIGQIEKRLEEIEAERGADLWTPEQLAIAGAVVTIGHKGKAEIERGLVRPEDMPKKAAKAKEEGKEGEEEQFPALSAGLLESLTAQRSAALAAELQQRPDIALAAVVHALALNVLFDSRDTSLQLAASKHSLERVQGTKAFEQLEASRAEWSRKLPADPAELWQWCLKQKQETLLKLLAVCAAATVNAGFNELYF